MTDLHPRIEAPVIWACRMFLVNNQGNFVEMTMDYSPGVYPHKPFAVPTVEDAFKQALKALKLKTKDLTWRVPTANEFVTFTSSGKVTHAFASKYQEPYTVTLELLDGTEANGLGNNIQQEGVPEGEQPRGTESSGLDKGLQESKIIRE